MDQTEKTLRWAEEQIVAMFHAVDEIGDIIGQARQNLLYNTRGATVYEPPSTNCTITGTVNGCDGNPIPDGGTITAEVDGITYGPVSTSGGAYVLNVFGANGDTIDVTWTPPASGDLARFQATTSAGAGTVVVNSTSTMTTFGPDPATGYQCFDLCPYPLSETLNGTDPTFGAITFNWNVISSEWEGLLNVNYPTCVIWSCPGQVGLDIGYSLTPAGNLTVIYDGVPGTGCPNLTGSTLAIHPARFALACVPFSASFSVSSAGATGGLQLYCTSGFPATTACTITE